MGSGVESSTLRVEFGERPSRGGMGLLCLQHSSGNHACMITSREVDGSGEHAACNSLFSSDKCTTLFHSDNSAPFYQCRPVYYQPQTVPRNTASAPHPVILSKPRRVSQSHVSTRHPDLISTQIYRSALSIHLLIGLGTPRSRVIETLQGWHGMRRVRT